MMMELEAEEQLAEEPAAAAWDRELGDLLTELSAAQDELLVMLAHKQQLLVRTDMPGIANSAEREQALLARLQRCQDRRAALLAHAEAAGRPSDNLRALAGSLPADQQQALRAPLSSASARARLLQHQSLTSWVLTQRTLLHLAQMLELIATGGRRQPTYSPEAAAFAAGALVDQQA